jgi:nitroreductase
VRRYARRRIPQDIVHQVVAIARDVHPLHPEIAIRWYIVWEGSVLAQRLSGRAGIYGILSSAPHFILAVSQERPGYMENMGYCMEHLILGATALGLGTCWIGEMFTEDGLQDFVPDLGPDERIIALTPLGYAVDALSVDQTPVDEASADTLSAHEPSNESEMGRLVQHLIRWSSERQGNRKPLQESISRDTWVVPWVSGLEAKDDTLDRILELVQLGPSWANTQPWHFVVDTVADELQVIATVDHTPRRGNVREGKPYYRLDGGIAMCHLHLAAQALGWHPTWNERSTDGPDRAESHTARWHVLQATQQAQIRIRYGIPSQYDILGVYV